MKKKDVHELHQKSVGELSKLRGKTETELVQLRTDFGAGKLKNVHQIKAQRRVLARVKTILREKELSATNESPTKK